MISGCGTYLLHTVKSLPACERQGRPDYHLIYVTSGKAHLCFGKEEYIVTPGHMVLLQPRQEQKYELKGIDTPEIFWVHFTGSNVKNILEHYEIPFDNPVFYSGILPKYAYYFREIITELQMCGYGYEEMTEIHLKHILLLVQRTRREQKSGMAGYIYDEMERARKYFISNYNQSINIEKYARSKGMSVSWFQRNFKQFTGYTAVQYLLEIRVMNAVTLLETTDYSVAEISAMVGYDDQLYFSRLFKKLKGVPPSEYRKLQKKKV